MKAIQTFNDEYLHACQSMTTEEIAQFLEDFRIMHANESQKSKLISLKISPSLLNSFKIRCKLEGFKYQTKIKQLMSEYLKNV